MGMWKRSLIAFAAALAYKLLNFDFELVVFYLLMLIFINQANKERR